MHSFRLFFGDFAHWEGIKKKIRVIERFLWECENYGQCDSHWNISKRLAYPK